MLLYFCIPMRNFVFACKTSVMENVRWKQKLYFMLLQENTKFLEECSTCMRFYSPSSCLRGSIYRALLMCLQIRVMNTESTFESQHLGIWEMIHFGIDSQKIESSYRITYKLHTKWCGTWHFWHKYSSTKVYSFLFLFDYFSNDKEYDYIQLKTVSCELKLNSNKDGKLKRFATVVLKYGQFSLKTS